MTEPHKNHLKSPPIVIYGTDDQIAKVSVRLEDETVWLAQQQLADLYSTSRPNVTMHIRNIFADSELREDAVCKKFLQTAANGKNCEVMFYNLDMIISLGYLDFFERQAERQAPMTMRDWAAHLDNILTASGEQLLEDAGRINREQAIEKARAEYVKYQARTLSEVEKQYLASLKSIATTVKKKGRKTGKH
ncbi:MAG: virulence RhuM family protein [Verrucomicrobiales bacterium]|nr:virulence RhuM family protein [Verrucomicrobiales bacterium]